MRFDKIVLLVAAILLFSGISFAVIDTSPCADGTAYGKCSKNPPGAYCTGAAGSHALVKDTTHTVCKCSDTAGYVESGEDCVLAKCDDGTSAGYCATTKPKVCIGGSTYADNATKCHCPAGMNESGLFCVYPPCNDDGIIVQNGVCAVKSVGKKCVEGKLVDNAGPSPKCPCKEGTIQDGEKCVIVCIDGTKVGECSTTKPKECVLTGTGVGWLKDNAATCHCPEGQVASGLLCAKSDVLGALTGADVLGGAAGNQTSTGTDSTGALSCCCLPAALIGIAGGFAFSRKK